MNFIPIGKKKLFIKKTNLKILSGKIGQIGGWLDRRLAHFFEELYLVQFLPETNIS